MPATSANGDDRAVLAMGGGQVLDKAGKAVPNVYCIGDANGKYMLAHAASAQGISAVENMSGRPHVLNHLSIPAACFTHPEVPSPRCVPSVLHLSELLSGGAWLLSKAAWEHAQVSFVGMTEEAAREKAEKEGWGNKVAVTKTSFKANSKALAEKEGEGMAKLIYR